MTDNATPSPFDLQPHVLLAFPDLALDDEAGANAYPHTVYGPFPDRASADAVAKRTMAYSNNVLEPMRLESPRPTDLPQPQYVRTIGDVVGAGPVPRPFTGSSDQAPRPEATAEADHRLNIDVPVQILRAAVDGWRNYAHSGGGFQQLTDALEALNGFLPR